MFWKSKKQLQRERHKFFLASMRVKQYEDLFKNLKTFDTFSFDSFGQLIAQKENNPVGRFFSVPKELNISEL